METSRASIPARIMGALELFSKISSPVCVQILRLALSSAFAASQFSSLVEKLASIHSVSAFSLRGFWVIKYSASSRNTAPRSPWAMGAENAASCCLLRLRVKFFFGAIV